MSRTRLYPKNEIPMPLKKNPKKKNQTSFKPGNKVGLGNKSKLGQPDRDREARQVKAIDKFLIDGYITNNSHLKLHELKQKIQNGQMSVLEHMLVQGMIVACETGSPEQRHSYLDRMIGRVPNKLEISKVNPFEGMTDEQLINQKKLLESSNQRTLQLIEAQYRIIEPQQEITTDDSANRETTPRPDSAD